MSRKASFASPTRPISDGITMGASSTFDRLMTSMSKQKGGASSSTRLQPQLTSYSLVLTPPSGATGDISYMFAGVMNGLDELRRDMTKRIDKVDERAHQGRENLRDELTHVKSQARVDQAQLIRNTDQCLAESLAQANKESEEREARMTREIERLLNDHESPRRRKIEESMRVSSLSTLPEDEWERYQSELESKTGATWNRVNFMERSWEVIRRYETQSIMKVGLNQPIMREVLEKIMNSIESDVLTESVTEDNADDQQVTKKLPIRRAKKGLKRLKGKTGSRAVNQRVVKSKASTVVASLTSAGRSGENGQGDGATLGRKREPDTPMLLAGLTTTATKSKKTARTLADTKLEMEIISQCGSGGLDDYRPSGTIMARMKLGGQLDVVEYSRVTVPELVHMGDPAGGFVEMLKARNSARGHLMAWSEKRAMQEYLKGLTESSNLNRKEDGTVMSSEANKIGL